MRKPRRIPPATIEALLGGEAWQRYSALRALPSLAASEAELEEARKASVASDLVQGLVAELGAWPGKSLSSHKSPDQLFHRLSLAAELGLQKTDRGAKAIAATVMATASPEGPFGLQMNISTAHGGSGEDICAWALCDAPVTLRALARLGYAGEPAFKKAVNHLIGLKTIESGWPCATSPSLGFRGPGKKGDPCPYATLVMLELLLELPDRRGGSEASSAAACLLDLWEGSRTEHPYIFYMGTDFRKIKAPMLWYDLLHILDALSRIESVRKDRRLAEMLDILEAKGGEELLFTPESVYQAWKGRDFGQKKLPSAYLTALALGVLGRTGRVTA
jgi:hypothetical protein